MIDPTARCPKWLIDRIRDSGGSISFYKYMDLVLNDPENGFYSTGRLNIGKDGDFCTSPSLGNDFARLLAIQVVDWLLDLEKSGIESELFSLVEIGPGEGTLSRDLIEAISEIAPHLLKKIEPEADTLNYESTPKDPSLHKKHHRKCCYILRKLSTSFDPSTQLSIFDETPSRYATTSLKVLWKVLKQK